MLLEWSNQIVKRWQTVDDNVYVEKNVTFSKAANDSTSILKTTAKKASYKTLDGFFFYWNCEFYRFFIFQFEFTKALLLLGQIYELFFFT